uniref:Transcriptional regulator, RpiR family n=1 Tax=Loigolactobacillus rennini TaxID=238013 RepID=A0A1K2I5Y4_9LACO|nr:Transcriptional regulator, RpiR family [Loigolactobacillus rennini]
MRENMLLAIQEKLAQFSPAERQVAQYVLQHAEQVLAMNAQTLATKAGASPATVIRFSRTMGAKGFADFKIRLSAQQPTDKSLLTEITPTEDLATVKEKLSLRIRQTLAETNLSLHNTTIDKTVTVLQKSRSISVYGVGASLLAATDFEQKFSRLGVAPFLGRDADEVMAYNANQSHPGVLLLISNSGETPAVIKIAQAMPQSHTLILLTQAPKSTLGQLADLTLIYHPTAAPTKMRTAATTSLLAQLYVIDLVYYRYFQLHFQQNAKKIQQSYENIQHTRDH